MSYPLYQSRPARPSMSLTAVWPAMTSRNPLSVTGLLRTDGPVRRRACSPARIDPPILADQNGGHLSVHEVVRIFGDGVGPETIGAACRTVEASGVKVSWIDQS